MTQMTEQKLVGIVNTEFSNAMGVSGGELAEERAQAWDYYLSKPRGDEIDGESQVVTSDVSDVVDGIMPSLLRIFTTADNLVEFDPVGPEDEAGAAQESDYTNFTFFKRNPSFMILFYWFFDALLQKNGIVKAWWDTTEKVTTESYKGLTEDEMLELLGDDELEPIERGERLDPETGQIVHDIEFRRTETRGKANVDNVPPEEYRISADSRNLDPSKARMVGHEREVPRHELYAMDFPKDLVDELPAQGDSIDSPEEQARRDKTDDQTSAHAGDKSQDLILLREAYIKVDFDDDGIAELRQVFSSGQTILSNEVVDRQPFHILCPHPLPHKHFGLASGEKVDDLQDLNTTILRQTLNNLYHSNNPSHAVWEQAMGEDTMDDLLTTRVGTVKRFARPIPESYSTIAIPFTAEASFPMLEYFDKTKRDRTGVNSDAEGLTPDALKNIQQTVMMQAIDQSKQKIEAIARIFAETGIKSLFLHIHELLQKHQNKAEVIRLRGEWVEVDPQAWRNRYDMTVQIGLGIGTREQNLLHLNAIKDIQAQIIEAGGMNLIVTPQNVYRTASEYVKNANLKDPNLFFTDPGDELAPPPSSEQEELQRQQQELEARRQQLDQQRNEINQQKVQLDAQEQQLKHQREMLKLLEDKEKREDEFSIANEKLRNDLADMQMKLQNQREDMRIKAAHTDAMIADLMSRAELNRANVAKTMEEVDAQSIENAATESGVLSLVENADS